MNSLLDTIINCITFITLLGPLVISAIRYFAIRTNSKQLSTIASRAAIIVSALEDMKITNTTKRDIAIEKLIRFSNELRIPLTESQAVDYIEDAVRIMHEAKNDPIN